MSFFNKILEWVYPTNYICINCGQNYVKSEIKGICDSCLADINLIEDCCQICGREIYAETTDASLCNYCQENKYLFNVARSVGIYNGFLKKLLLQFKYNDAVELKRPLGHLLYFNFKQHFISKEIDTIIPVPIHDNRLQQRGYNQAELLAEELAIYAKIPLSVNLKRTRDIPPLYNFAHERRSSLLEGAFHIKKNYYQDQSLLLIDDIFTTGATANEIAGLLKNIGGARKVSILTIATARTY